MSWNIETIGKFFESWQSNPFEYNQLMTVDPTGRLWHGIQKAEQDYIKALHEHKALGVGEISSDPTKTAEMESIMNAALATRDTCKAGLETACALLAGQQEPSVQAIRSRAAYLRRNRLYSEANALDGLVGQLEALAVAAGV